MFDYSKTEVNTYCERDQVRKNLLKLRHKKDQGARKDIFIYIFVSALAYLLCKLILRYRTQSGEGTNL